jgi:hypothetical protein
VPEKVRRQAYATVCRLPIDATEARRLAERHLVPGAGLPEGTSLNIVEFESCFTVVKLAPAPQVGENGIPLHPANPGRGVVVIDKETGHFSFWPSWGESFVADRFAEAKAAGEIDYVSEWPVSRA